MSGEAHLYAVVVPFPAQGHVNPLMNFAELLAMRGFFITFVTTEWIEQRLLNADSKDAAACDREIQERGLKFGTANAISQTNAHILLSQGHIPVTKDDLKSKDKLITSLPGKIPRIRPTDIVSFYREKHVSETSYSVFLYEARIQNIADYLVVNTFEELEGGKEAQMGLSINGCPALAVGPVSLPSFLQGKNAMFSMWEEDETCLQWLDSKPKQSVLYVSFGSTAVKSERQLHELALGLEACGYPFLWYLLKIR